MNLAARINQWERDAERCWLAKERPSNTYILESFPEIDSDVGNFLANQTDFEISPVQARESSSVFCCYNDRVVDYFLLVFLRAILEDRVEADVCVILAATHLSELDYSEMCKRFSFQEVQIVREYFSLIEASRGRLHAEEIAALEVCDNAT